MYTQIYTHPNICASYIIVFFFFAERHFSISALFTPNGTLEQKKHLYNKTDICDDNHYSFMKDMI